MAAVPVPVLALCRIAPGARMAAGIAGVAERVAAAGIGLAAGRRRERKNELCWR